MQKANEEQKKAEIYEIDMIGNRIREVELELMKRVDVKADDSEDIPLHQEQAMKPTKRQKIEESKGQIDYASAIFKMLEQM